MRRTFKYRAKPSKDTESNAFMWLTLCRNLYNAALEQRISAYKKQGKSLSAFDQNYQLPELRKECPEFKQVGSQVLQDVTSRVDKAYKGFFRRVKQGKISGFPRFKGRNRYNSFTLKQTGWHLEGNQLLVKNVGIFKFKQHRPILGRIKTVTVCRKPTGKWYLCFSCDAVPARPYPFTGETIGLDVGISNLVTDSEGVVTDNQHFLKKSLAKLRKQQRRLANRKKSSNRRAKARLQVAKTHEHISNQRRDFLHKLSTDYIRKYDVIHIEKLNISGMLRNHNLAQSISDVGWSMFFDFLTYKAEEAGKSVVKVNPRNTSQKCSGCGKLVKKTLSVRVHKCPYCGLVLDRDFNASINIKGLKGPQQAVRNGPSNANVAGHSKRGLRSLSL